MWTWMFTFIQYHSISIFNNAWKYSLAKKFIKQYVHLDIEFYFQLNTLINIAFIKKIKTKKNTEQKYVVKS